MSATPPEDRLSDKRYVSVTIRLLVDKGGQVVQGELVETAGRPQRRFMGWRGLVRVLQAALAYPAPDGAADALKPINCMFDPCLWDGGQRAEDE